MMASKQKLKLLTTKKIIQFSAFVKIEKNGIEIKNKLIQPNAALNISICENKYLQNDNTQLLLENIEIRNKNSDLICSFKKKDLLRQIDRFIPQGKLTLMFQKDKDRYSLFISKSTKELLDAFVLKLAGITNVPQSNAQISPKENQNQLPQNIIAHKRKFHELYQNKHNPTLLKKNKPIPINQIVNINFVPQRRFAGFPIDLLYQVFLYLDKNSIISKVSLLNKELKLISDNYIEKLIIRDETPSRIFNKILERFKSIRILVFGKAKNFKNENLKNLSVTLRNLEEVDLSYIENITNNNIKKLFSKANIKNITTIKMSYYLEGLQTALYYIFEFLKNLRYLSISNRYFDRSVKMLNNIVKFPKYYSQSLFQIIQQILLSSKHNLKRLDVFVFNAATPLIENNANLFSKITILSIDLLLIEKVKNLQIFYSCKNLIEFTIGAIAIKDDIMSKNKKEPVFNYIDFNNIQSQIFPQNNIDTDELLERLSIDFDNDYIEVFGKIFYYMGDSLKRISFGNFANDEICKLISIYLKKIEYIKFSSNLITDIGIQCILNSCTLISMIDLEGCTSFIGSCFFELNGIPTNLKAGIFSITTHNFYHVINFLRANGVAAENRIKFNNNN